MHTDQAIIDRSARVLELIDRQIEIVSNLQNKLSVISSNSPSTEGLCSALESSTNALNSLFAILR